MEVRDFAMKEIGAIPTAQLWIGKQDDLVGRAIMYLQKIYCKAGGCSYCSTCHKIINQQLHTIIWLTTERSYTLDQLEPIREAIAFALNPGERFFFVLQKADALTIVSANSLLKSIEEPPLGYHFILLADNHNDVLPTIRSRCIVSVFYAEEQRIKHQVIFNYFINQSTASPSSFLKDVEAANLSEHDVSLLLDQILDYWSDQLKMLIQSGKFDEVGMVMKKISVVERALALGLAQGGAMIFLKDLFLQMA